jgi:hypothetical protein
MGMLRRLREAIAFRSYQGMAWVITAATAALGFEAFIGVLGYAMMWPTAIPVLLVAIAVVHTVRVRVRRREAGGESEG